MASEPCVFCDIAAGEAPARRVAHLTWSIVIRPLEPVTPGHLLVIPKLHVADFRSDPVITAGVMADAAMFARDVMGTDVNLITSAGTNATQTVFHLHVHLVPRRAGDGLALPWTGQST